MGLFSFEVVLVGIWSPFLKNWESLVWTHFELLESLGVAVVLASLWPIFVSVVLNERAFELLLGQL